MLRARVTNIRAVHILHTALATVSRAVGIRVQRLPRTAAAAAALYEFLSPSWILKLMTHRESRGRARERGRHGRGRCNCARVES